MFFKYWVIIYGSNMAGLVVFVEIIHTKITVLALAVNETYRQP